MKRKFVVDEQDEDNIPEQLEEVIDEPVVVKEETISAADERRVAKELTGHPHPFDDASVRVLKILQERGIAAIFKEGWARGFRWDEFMRNSR